MDEFITLSHGSGGEKYRQLVNEIFLPAFSNDYLAPLNDSALLEGAPHIAMTTDSYVVKPLFFPGGDIGSLAISGTVNDLAVSGAVPSYISVGMILEAGLEVSVLQKIVASMAHTADRAGVRIVTGDTKVIESRGGQDGLWINTAGIGLFPSGQPCPPQKIEPGDKLIASGCIASHGISVLAARNDLQFAPPIQSDAAPMNKMTQAVINNARNTVHAMRDPTRGGVAAVLCEWVTENTDILLHESALPIRNDVSAACALLGLEPLHIANEGVILFAVPERCAESVLSDIRRSENGENAKVIGEVTEGRGIVRAITEFGSSRRIVMPRGELLPRIC